MDYIDYEKLGYEANRIIEELANIPLSDDAREGLVKELKTYNDILNGKRDAEEAEKKAGYEAYERSRDRKVGLIKTGVMSAVAITAIWMTTSFEKTGIVTSKAWQIATKLLPIAKI